MKAPRALETVTDAPRTRFHLAAAREDPDPSWPEDQASRPLSPSASISTCLSLAEKQKDSTGNSLCETLKETKKNPGKGNLPLLVQGRVAMRRARARARHMYQALKVSALQRLGGQWLLRKASNSNCNGN